MKNGCLKIIYLLSVIVLNNGFAMEDDSSPSFDTLPTEIRHKILENFHSDDSKDFIRLSQVNKRMRHTLKFLPLQLRLWQYKEKITDDILISLIELFPNIQFLNLGFCERITDEGLQTLAKLSRLKSLELYSTKCNNVVLKALSKLEQLVTLNLDNCAAITNEGLQYINNFKQLRLLDLKYCFKISIGTIQDLRSQLPDLVILWDIDDL